MKARVQQTYAVTAATDTRVEYSEEVKNRSRMLVLAAVADCWLLVAWFLDDQTVASRLTDALVIESAIMRSNNDHYPHDTRYSPIQDTVTHTRLGAQLPCIDI